MSEEGGKELNVDDVVKTHVVRIVDSGIIVDFDGYSGFIFYRNIVPRVEHGCIGSIFSEGDEIVAIITEIKDDGRISLSMKIPKRVKQAALAREVMNDLSTLSEEDTSIRSVWKALTKIEHYLLKYMQTPIPFKKDSVHFNSKGDLLAEIDSDIHLDLFKSEVKRIYNAEVFPHDRLPGYWYFDTDISLISSERRTYFADECANMYVQLDSDPIIEIHIEDISYSDRKLFFERMSNYYPQLRILNDTVTSFCIIISYKTPYGREDLKTELRYAIDSILNGTPDTTEDGNIKEYSSISFKSKIVMPDDAPDRFLFTLDKEALHDNEGVRFGGLKGQGFITSDDTGSFSIGVLKKITYPQVTFSVNKENIERVRALIAGKNLTKVKPDPDDLTGEFEKVNRLSDSFDRITEHPEELVNPKLASYLFDASKAMPLDSDKIEKRKERIIACQLNKDLNDSQVEAIAKAVEAQDMSLIQGPPGTGKSTAIAELLWQLVLDNPNNRVLLTSEANLAVDNALDRIKYSRHNIIKPVRIAAGEKFSTEGFSYSQVEMKKWAGIQLTEIEEADDNAAAESKEYKDFDSQELVLCRWLNNILSRSKIIDETLQYKWISFINNAPASFKSKVYNEYITHCNVIGATCSAITDTNYSATEQYRKHADSRFLKKYRAVFGDTDKEGQSIDLSFDVVIQDEASKATPSELSLPLAYGKKAVIIGDHRQLPPNLDKDDILFKLHMLKIKSNSREEHDEIEGLERYVKKKFEVLEKSHFERLFKQIDESIKGTFHIQYRMHNDINEVIQQFYIEDGGLECGVKEEERTHGISIPGFINPDDHVIWVDTLTPEIKEGTSRYNPGEVDAIKWVLEQLGTSPSFREYQSSLSRAEDKEIGLITFYGAQLKALKTVVDSSRQYGLKIKMSSVDRFQGMERNIIIVSLVRSNIIAQYAGERPDYKKYPEYGYESQKGYGFADSPNRLNVALSRAKRLLIIVGNGKHFCSFKNKEGKAIYKNVFDVVQKHPNGIYTWKTVNYNYNSTKVIRVPMPTSKSINLNSRDINTSKDINLRSIETWLTRDNTAIDNPHFAVLELSTKAVKVLWGRKEEKIRQSQEFSFDNFYRQAYKTETGQGLNSDNMMDIYYFSNRVLPVIRRMKELMKKEQIDVVYTVATAAYRTAKNRDEIIELIRKDTGINVRILSKQEESIATMYAYGISSKYRLGIREAKNSFMIEQGGGSTEVSVFHHGEPLGSYSINIGTTTSRNAMFVACEDNMTVDMREALKRSDQIIKERMVAFMNNMGDLMKDEDEYFCVSVGTAITRATGHHRNAQQHDKILTREKIEAQINSSTEKICERFSSIEELYEWNQEVGNNSELDGIVTMRLGLPLFLYFFDKFNVKEIHVCGTGLWYGIYFQKLFNTLEII